MKRTLFPILIVSFLAGCQEVAISTSPPSSPAPAPPAAGRLDWTASNRWVHVDNIRAEGVPVFEGARRRWLATLRKSGGFLPDGRPLFWSGTHGNARTYLTFFPYADIAELNQRRQAARATEAKVGKGALDDYNAGDVALVPPHYSQLWFRDPDLDFISPIAGALTELSATHARIQFQQQQVYGAATRIDAAWKAAQSALTQARYPLTCRTFFAGYGTGLTVRVWLATDLEALRKAPPLPRALQEALGEERGAALAAELTSLLSTQDEFEIERRDDLSNLAP